jgi:hypothetical protein
MTAQFSRDAGRLLSSPYFHQPPEDLSGQDLVDWWEARGRDKEALEAAFQTCNDSSELQGEARRIWDEAAEQLVNQDAQQDLNERLLGNG